MKNRESFWAILLKTKYWISEFFHSEIHLQAQICSLQNPKLNRPFHVKIIDMENYEDLHMWMNIVNESYSELSYSASQAKKFLQDHHFLTNIKTSLVFDDKTPIASVSYGLYRNKPLVGGVTRLAVTKKYRGKGLGKFIILFGYQKLKEQGISYGESVISSHRTTSIITHLKCGFTPQFNKELLAHQTSNYTKNFVQRIRAKRAIKKAYRLLKSETSTKK